MARSPSNKHPFKVGSQEHEVALKAVIESQGGNLNLVAEIMEVNRTTVWRWVTMFDLEQFVDEQRIASNPQHRRRNNDFALLVRDDPEQASAILKDAIWRNEGIIEAIAKEMGISWRTVYWRIDRLSLRHVLYAAREARLRKFDVIEGGEDAEPPRVPSLHLSSNKRRRQAVPLNVPEIPYTSRRS